jgi:hypothetical protein
MTSILIFGIDREMQTSKVKVFQEYCLFVRMKTNVMTRAFRVNSRNMPRIPQQCRFLVIVISIYYECAITWDNSLLTKLL